MSTLKIAEVSDARSASEWALLPHRVYRGEPGWVPPLRSDAVRDLNPRHNPFHRHAETKHFLLKKGSETVGRMSATVHPTYNERHGRRDVFFGFPVVEEGVGSIGPLLDACSDFGRSKGMTDLSGPFNYWSGAECGVLVDRFEEPPVLFQTWNPQGLREELQQHGFTHRREMAAYEVTLRDLDPVRPDLFRMAHHVEVATGVTTRPLNMQDFTGDFETIRQLHEEAFARDAEVVPYPRDVFEQMTGALRALLDPSLVRIAERDGEPIGFGVSVPDINCLLRAWGGRMGPLDFLRFPLDKRAIDSVVVLLMGVLPTAPMGVGHVLFADTLRAVEEGGYQRIHTTWVHQQDSIMKRLLESSINMQSTRRWVVMSRGL